MQPFRVPFIPIAWGWEGPQGSPPHGIGVRGTVGPFGVPFIAMGWGWEGSQGSPLSPTLWDRGEGDCATLWGPLHLYWMGVEGPPGVPIVPTCAGGLKASDPALRCVVTWGWGVVR